MAENTEPWFLWVWTATELAALACFIGLLATSLVGDSPIFSSVVSSVSRPVRAGLVAFLILQLLIPIWVYVDMRRETHFTGTFWVHVAAMPGINLFGLIAYLLERKRKEEG